MRTERELREVWLLFLAINYPGSGSHVRKTPRLSLSVLLLVVLVMGGGCSVTGVGVGAEV